MINSLDCEHLTPLGNNFVTDFDEHSSTKRVGFNRNKQLSNASVTMEIKSDTLAPELIGYSTSDTVIEPQKYYTYQVSGQNFDQLKDMFNLENQHEIYSYLYKNPHLFDALEFVYNVLKEHSELGPFILEHYKDIEEGWEKLYILINTNIDSMDELDSLEDEIYYKAFHPIDNLTHGNLVLTVS